MTDSKNVLESIQLIGYEGPLLELKALEKALKGGCKDVEFTKLISFLSHEIKAVTEVDELVQPITSSENSCDFIMECTSLLKELQCAYKFLTEGEVSKRFDKMANKLLLIDFLTTAVMAGRMTQDSLKVSREQLSVVKDIEAILNTLGYPKPPPCVPVGKIMSKISEGVETLTLQHPQLVGKPLLDEKLNEGEWKSVEKINEELHEDFTIRRKMMLKRLDCTVQSFDWCDKAKGQEEKFDEAFYQKRGKLKDEINVDLADLLCARDDVAVMKKASDSSVRKNTKSSVNTVIIGKVPDRGGRVDEQAPPPSEMPSWKPRSTGTIRKGRRF